jgi:hypothetical protein
MVQFGNRRLIVRQQAQVAAVVADVELKVMAAMVEPMVAAAAVLDPLVQVLLAPEVLLFLHIIRPLLRVLQLLEQPQPLVPQQPQLHLQLQLVMVVQPLLHIPQQVVQVGSPAH